MLSQRTSKALAGINKATKQDGVKIKHLYKIMTSHTELWWHAYAKLARNKGALTPGVDDSTLDGMSQRRIDRLMESLKAGTYLPKPVRRTYIPKKNGKRRPLGIPSADDKLVQEVVRILLEQIYEPVFSDHSHGFRPERSCHSALIEMKQKWKGIKWVVDVDVKAFYDSIDHQMMIDILERKIDDVKFISLIRSFLKAGFLEDWKFTETFSGTPQGGICSPILANIFLNELDWFIERKRKEFDRGEKRKKNPEYVRMEKRVQKQRRKLRMWKERGSFDFFLDEIEGREKVLEVEMKQMPSQDFSDPNYKRLHYIRYADDFACGIIGSKEDALKLKSDIAQFLSDLKLEISEEKSAIHHIKDGFEYLGYHISLDHQNGILRKAPRGKNRYGDTVHGTIRAVTVQLKFLVPRRKVWEFCRRKGYILENDKPVSRWPLLSRSDYEIVSTYNAEMRGFANYYNLAPKKNLEILQWYGQTSLFKTLANKHRSQKWHIIRQIKTRNNEYFLEYTHKGVQRKLQVFQVKNRAEAILSKVDQAEPTFKFNGRTDLLDRVFANKCEYCGTDKGPFDVHHIRSVKDIKEKKTKAPWQYHMSVRNRKTMVLCEECHSQLHWGKLPSWKKDFYVQK